MHEKHLAQGLHESSAYQAFSPVKIRGWASSVLHGILCSESPRKLFKNKIPSPALGTLLQWVGEEPRNVYL